MAYMAILGRDFSSHPSIILSFDDKLTVSRKTNETEIERTNEIMSEILNIECVADPISEEEKLKINSDLDHKIVEKIKKLYATDFVNIRQSNNFTTDFEMKITLKNDKLVAFKPRRLSFSDREKLQVILDDLLERKIIRPSESPYASPIVLVNKKNGGTRLCIDYRELNKITVKDNFPSQLIDDNIDRLKNKKYFTTLDLKDGYYNVKMSEDSVKFTSFVTPLGQFEFLYCPFGLTNAPKVFGKYVQKIFHTLIRQNKILIFFDDFLIATESLEEHLLILQEIFKLSAKHNLTFKLDKCHFAQNRIDYLGYHITENGIQPSDDNIASVLNYPIPRNSKETLRFVSLASYFRRFIPQFSTIAKPLYDLVKKDAKFKFEEKQIEAFESLKSYLSTKPILDIYSHKAETELHCDASALGFGAILLQKQDDSTWRPISYFSQRTTTTEAKYHSFELECLAVVYAIKRYHIYLAGTHFKIITDCDSFRLTLSKQTINPRISRWAMFLQEYNFEIQHRPGKRMSHVDALSRCHSILVIEANTFEQTLSICQDRDEEICRIRDELQRTELKFFELRNGLVYRKNKQKKLLFYVPRSMENNVIRTCHDEIGHVGLEKVINNITKIYWFPALHNKVKEYISNCLRCIQFSPSNGKQEGQLHSIEKEKLPFQTVHIDHLGPLEKTGRGYKYLLTIIDAFTKFIKIYPCKSTKSEECIKHLLEYFRNYSRPKRLISDRGTTFTSNKFNEFLEKEMIKHVLIAVGTPRANGQIERYNRILTPMIAKLCDTPDKWDRVLEEVEFAINNTVSRVTNETPCKLLFGIDQTGKVNDSIRHTLNLENNERTLEQIRGKAVENIIKSQKVNETYYNKRRKEAFVYNIGDYIMIRNVDTSAGVNKKLIPKYKGPYQIEKILDNDRYIVNDIEGFQITQLPYNSVVAADNMRPYIS